MRKVTSIQLDEKIHKDIKIIAAKEQKKIWQIIDEACREYLKINYKNEDTVKAT